MGIRIEAGGWRLEAGDWRLEDRKKEAIKAGGTLTLVIWYKPSRERGARQEVEPPLVGGRVK